MNQQVDLKKRKSKILSNNLADLEDLADICVLLICVICEICGKENKA
jgi:hypothetical protein